MPTDKVNFTSTLDRYRARRGRFDVIDVPLTRYLMVDGHGDPNTTPDYADTLAALYPIAYAVKFASKHELGRDYVVPPLEGLWWADDMEAFTTARDKSRWHWTMLLMIPEWVDDDRIWAGFTAVGTRNLPRRLVDVRVASLEEGRSVQTLHVGSFDDEGPVLERMHHEVIPAMDAQPHGKHHEVYLSDVRRAAPARMRTILRQPIVRGDGADGA